MLMFSVSHDDVMLMKGLSERNHQPPVWSVNWPTARPGSSTPSTAPVTSCTGTISVFVCCLSSHRYIPPFPTRSFSYSFPMVAVSIGFAVRKEVNTDESVQGQNDCVFMWNKVFVPQLEFGVIYHCSDGTLYTARRGHGAFCNGARLRVSREKGQQITDLISAINHNQLVSL